MAPRKPNASDKAAHIVREECRKWVMVNLPDTYEKFYAAAYDRLGAKKSNVGRPLGSKNKTTN